MKYIVAIIVLSAVAVLLTAGLIIWFAVDLKRAKSGKKAVLWERKEKLKGKEQLTDLLTEFDEMGYCPTTLCPDPEAAAKQWQKQVFETIAQTEREVRKETAKEIYKMLLGTEHIKELEQKEHCDWWVSKWRIEDLNRVFKEFGVEVEQ